MHIPSCLSQLVKQWQNILKDIFILKSFKFDSKSKWK